MPDQKISQDPVTTLASTTILPVVRPVGAAFVNERTTLSAVAAALGPGGVVALPFATRAVFNVKEFGALGDGVTNDAAAINLAVAQAATSGGVVYFPPGHYLYGGDSIDHEPGASTLAPLYIVGAGRNASRITFTSVTKHFCIRIASAAPMGSGLNIGGGVHDITITAAAGKDAIILHNIEFGVIERIYTYGGRHSIHLLESRSCTVRTATLQQWTGNAILLNNDTCADHHDISDVRASGAVGSDWGIRITVGASAAGLAGSQWTGITVTSAGQGAFLVEYAGTSPNVPVFQWFVNCVGDGSFGTNTFYYRKVSEVHTIACHGLSHLAFAHGFVYDACADCEQVGGVAYADGASGGDFAFLNACTRLTFVGVRSAGTVLAYKAADGSTHTNITFNNPPTKAPSVSNDLAKFTSVAHAGCVAYRASDQLVPNGPPFTDIVFDVEESDNGAFYSTASGIVTATSKCRLLITASVTFQTNSAGQRFVRFVKNGSAIIAPVTQNATTVGEHTMSAVAIVNLEKNDTLKVQATQTSGGPLYVLLSDAGNQRTRVAVETIKAW